MASFGRWSQAGDVRAVRARNSAAGVWTYWSFKLDGSVSRMPTPVNLGLVFWNKFWNVQKMEKPRKKSKGTSPSLNVCVHLASTTSKERKDVHVVCVWIFLPLSSSSYNVKVTWRNRNVKHCTYSTVCVMFCFLNKVQKERAVQGLAEVQSYCLLISRQPWGFLSFLV